MYLPSQDSEVHVIVPSLLQMLQEITATVDIPLAIYGYTYHSYSYDNVAS